MSTSGAKARMLQIEPSGAHLVDFWSQCQNASNRAFWSSFCRFPEPRPENAQIKPSGSHFVDFWSQGLKMLKSTLLEFILSTSGAKAGMPQIELSVTHFVDFWSQGQNASNRTFRSSFCRLVEPRPQSFKSNLLGIILIHFHRKN